MRRELLIVFVLAGLTLGIYWPVRNYDFVQYDDPQFITENTLVQKGLTPAGLSYAVTHPLVGNWHPVTTISHLLDCELFGTDPGAHHMVNVIIHMANSVLLFIMLRRMTGATWRSALVAAIFAWHPLRVESVAWISERKDVLSGFFLLLTILAYGRFTEFRNQKRTAVLWYSITLLLFALALMSKPMVVTLPFLLLLLDYWPLKRVGGQVTALKTWLPLMWEKTPFFGLSALGSYLTYAIQKQAGAMSLMQSLSWPERAGNAAVSYVKYLGKLIWPTDLAVVYPHPAKEYFLNDRWAMWQVLAAVAVLVLITALCLLRLRRLPWLGVGWFWFLGMLVPVIGLVQVGEQAMADRYTYLPSIGAALAFVWVGHELFSTVAASCSRQVQILRFAASTAAAIAVTFAVLSSRQLQYWRNTVALFEHTAAVTADNPSAQFSIGVGLEKSGQIQQAMAQYRVALAIDPNYVKAHYNLGQLLRKESHWRAAAGHYQAALRCNPNDVPTHLNLAGVLQELGQSAEAVSHYEEALRLDPSSTEALNNLAWLLATSPQSSLRNGARAVELAERACTLSEFKQPIMIGTLAAAFAEAGRFEEAIQAAEKACGVATEMGQPEVVAKNTELRELYRGKQPYRDAGTTNP